eukprot:scaffold9685_cov51-Cyclotella_meneghiniana.AAC.4
MSSATTFSSVDSQREFIPSLEFIKSPQKKRPSARPPADVVHAWFIQFTALVLSHQANNTGQGSSITSGSTSRAVRAAQYQMKARSTEYPPAPTRHASDQATADGSLLIMCAIGVSKVTSASWLVASVRKSISALISFPIGYLFSLPCTSFAAFRVAKFI